MKSKLMFLFDLFVLSGFHWNDRNLTFYDRCSFLNTKLFVEALKEEIKRAVLEASESENRER